MGIKSEEQRKKYNDRMRAWRLANPERQKEIAAASYARNCEKRRLYQRKKYGLLTHEEAEIMRSKQRAYYRLYYAQNKERILARNRLVKQLMRSLGQK